MLKLKKNVIFFYRFRRRTFVTPKSFLSFINFYKVLYKERLENINNMSFRMSNGLSKLVDAKIQVDELKVVLEKNQADIAVKNVQVEAVSETFSPEIIKLLTRLLRRIFD